MKTHKPQPPASLGAATGSALYETHYDSADHPQWVTRVKHGPYVAYHYISEAADQLTAMLNERIALLELRAAVLAYERISDTQYALGPFVGDEHLKPEFRRLLRALHATMPNIKVCHGSAATTNHHE